jgi:hypothetical protein
MHAHECDGIIKMDLREIGREGAECFWRVQNNIQRQACVKRRNSVKIEVFFHQMKNVMYSNKTILLITS